MDITIRKLYTGGTSLKVAIERPSTGLFFDSATSTFKAPDLSTDLALTPGTGRRATIFGAIVAGMVEDEYVLEFYDADTGELVDIEGVPVIVDERIKAVIIGDVVRDKTTGVNTFAAVGDPDTPAIAFAPSEDGNRRFVTDLRVR